MEIAIVYSSKRTNNALLILRSNGYFLLIFPAPSQQLSDSLNYTIKESFAHVNEKTLKIMVYFSIFLLR